MSPAPDPNTTNEEILLNSVSTAMRLNPMSSSDELDPNVGAEQMMGLG